MDEYIGGLIFCVCVAFGIACFPYFEYKKQIESLKILSPAINKIAEKNSVNIKSDTQTIIRKIQGE